MRTIGEITGKKYLEIWPQEYKIGEQRRKDEHLLRSQESLMKQKRLNMEKRERLRERK